MQVTMKIGVHGFLYNVSCQLASIHVLPVCLSVELHIYSIAAKTRRVHGAWTFQLQAIECTSQIKVVCVMCSPLGFNPDVWQLRTAVEIQESYSILLNYVSILSF